MQLVCDSEMIITNVNARYPGSTHDSHVFSNSRLHTLLENLHNNQPDERNFLIGIIEPNILNEYEYTFTHLSIYALFRGLSLRIECMANQNFSKLR